MEKKKKKLGTPHTLVIIVCLIILAAAATYVVPSGEFVRFEDPVSGRTVVEAGSYTSEGTNPVSFLRIPGVMYQGILEAVDVIAFLMIIGGAFELVNTSGAILALCRTVGKKLKGKEIFVVPMFLTLFAIFGTTMGMSNEVAIFVPIGITMALTLGLDKVTGMAMVAVGAATGFTAGLMNPFTVGVAQDIAGVPLFSGMGFRAVLLIAMLIIDTFYIIAYERKIKKHPEKSILAGLPDEKDFVPDEGADEKITGRQAAVLVVLFGTLAILIYGLLIYQWYFEEMASLFLVMGVICGFLAGLSPSKIATTFTTGAKGLAGSALTVGFARGIIIGRHDHRHHLKYGSHGGECSSGRCPEHRLLPGTDSHQFRHHLRFRNGGGDHPSDVPCGGSDRPQPSDAGSCLPDGRRILKSSSSHHLQPVGNAGGIQGALRQMGEIHVPAVSALDSARLRDHGAGRCHWILRIAWR